MEIVAKLNYLRIAPRKMRLLADLIRGKEAGKAKALLNFNLKRGALPLKKLLDSALANTRNNFQLDPDNLFVSKITVDEGPKMKRWRARARGRAMRIEKNVSHITLILESSIMPKKKKPEKIGKARIKTVEEDIKKEVLPRKEPDRQKTEEKAPQKSGRFQSKRSKKQDSQGKSRSFVSKVFRRKSV